MEREGERERERDESERYKKMARRIETMKERETVSLPAVKQAQGGHREHYKANHLIRALIC